MKKAAGENPSAARILFATDEQHAQSPRPAMAGHGASGVGVLHMGEPAAVFGDGFLHGGHALVRDGGVGHEQQVRLDWAGPSDGPPHNWPGTCHSGHGTS